MSNHLAIATVTATLQRTLQVSIQNEFEGARITTVSPSEVGKGTPETGVNIFMYQVITNPALHNVDVAPMRTRATPVKRQAALDLYYMLSCYGNNNDLAPQRLLGSVVQAMNDRRVITQDMIREACQDATLSFLHDSNLADQVQKINVLPLDLNLEDLSKTWSVFFQTPYILSVAYKALVVLVDGRESLGRALPVRGRSAGGLFPFSTQPNVERVVSKAGITEPIFADSTVLIKGKQLKGMPQTQIRIGAIEVTPTTVSPTQIEFSLATLSSQELRGGVQTLQVVHPLMEMTSGNQRRRRGLESNGIPLVVRPKVVQTHISQIVDVDDDLCDAHLSVTIDLSVEPKQKGVLSLSEWWDANDTRWQSLKDKDIDPPATYLFDAAKRQELDNTLHFAIHDVKPGAYLVRILIDGAESLLEMDLNEWLDPDTKQERNPHFNWYVGPRIRIDLE